MSKRLHEWSEKHVITIDEDRDSRKWLIRVPVCAQCGVNKGAAERFGWDCTPLTDSGEAKTREPDAADTRRLDWLEERLRTQVWDFLIQWDHEDGYWLSESERGLIPVPRPLDDGPNAPTLRGAIDAAMKAHSGEDEDE